MTTEAEVIVYHDETDKAGPNGNLRGHILYFVPRLFHRKSSTPLFGAETEKQNPQDHLIELAYGVMRKYEIENHRLHFTDLSGRKWYSRTEAYRQITDLAVDSLRNKSPKLLNFATNCKMAVMLYPANTDTSLFGGEKKEQVLRNDETIIRMLLKGALHYLYSSENKIELVGIVSDGDPHHRSLDKYRILEQMEYGDPMRTRDLREYVSAGDSAQVLPLSSDPKEHKGRRALEHAMMLQMTDLLFGATLRACFEDISNCSVRPTIGKRLERWGKKDVVAYPVRKMLEKQNRDYAFRKSGHYSSFTVSQVEFKESGPEFTDVSLIRSDDKPNLFS